jgi:hypothetical protein
LKALPPLEVWVEDFFKGLAAGEHENRVLDHEAKVRRLATQARMQAALIWKAYLFALNTDPANWGTDATCALASLRILSRADSAKVLSILRDEGKAATVRENARDGDWPPRGFINLYLKNGDLVADKLLSIASLKQGDIEVVKDVARRNARRHRQRLDQGARARPEDSAKRIAQFNTIDQIKNAYSEMHRDDFCEVVAGVVGSGKLSDDDASFALYRREWVMSEGDLRLSFPEWLEAEGRERFLWLNREWLQSGLRHTSFNDWLAITDSRRM